MASPSRAHSRSSGMPSGSGLGFALAFGLVLVLARPAVATGTRFVIIASADAPVTGVTLEEFQRLFQFRKATWKAGAPLNVLLPAPGTPARLYLLANVYHCDENALHRYLVEKQFRGDMDHPPLVAGSDAMAIETVAGSHGLVSLVPAESAGLAHVKVLKVEGKSSGEDGYPIVR